TFTYYDTGALRTAVGTNSATTTYLLNSDAGCKNSFVAETEEPISGLTTEARWNCSGGVQTSATDENSQTTNLDYSASDGTWRLTEVSAPDGGDVTYSLPDRRHLEAQTKIDASTTRTDWTILDPLGRPQFRQTGNSSNCDTVQMDLDSAGRAIGQSNPYATACTGGTSTPSAAPSGTSSSLSLDGLDRPKTATAVDGSQTGFTYLGNAIEQTDPRSVSNIRAIDGLGRLEAVCEVTASGPGDCGLAISGTGFKTTYSSNELGKMTGVNQNAGTQTRAFTYDWLGRLTQETNPESNTTYYTYDTSSDAACGSGGST